MIIQSLPPLHLAYGLNVHRGETWDETFAAIRDHALLVRNRVAKGRPFGLALRISNEASLALMGDEALDRFHAFMDEQRLYAFTINGFPFGSFHDGRVKESVYQPDWRSIERRDYTIRLGTILARLLPDGVSGSISTVPISFKPWMTSEADMQRAADHLRDVARHLQRISEDSGKDVHIGLEPEPSCYLETTDEFVNFFNDVLLARGDEKIIRSRIGVCFDTCHVALQFEDPVASLSRYKKEGIRVSKVQLSAALETTASREGVDALRAFAEPIYLHQVRAQGEDDLLAAWSDLPDALRDLPRHIGLDRVRVHFHVPLYWQGGPILKSTAATLTPQFFELLRSGITEHVEMETYTFDVLPEAERRMDVVESVVREYKWTLDRLQVSP
jgi:sugar phosphate isomerase/epimerase